MVLGSVALGGVGVDVPAVWRTRPGAVAVAFAPGADIAAVAAVAFDPATGRPVSRLVLVDPASGRERSAVAYRNSNCCGVPAVGAVAADGVYAAGDELVVVSGRQDAPRRMPLPAFTMDAAAGGGWVVVGSGRGDVLAFHGMRVVWRARHPELMAVALSPAGLVAVASPRAVAVFDEGGRQVREIFLTATRAVDVAFAQPALLVVARRTVAGDLVVQGVDTGTWGVRWALRLGATTLPVVEAAGAAVVVSDLLGRTGAVLTPSGVVRHHWTGPAGWVYAAGSPHGAVAVARGSRVRVYDGGGRMRWQGTALGRVLGLRLHEPWLAVIGTTTPQTYAPDHVWFFRVDGVGG